ncbi:DUF4332 domain-containing protein [Luteolibacter flavescens]|uniref:DUF4332 domain-containing protein n=1 Tax=Luteolibacter flavescens TaxID=1859460 RepID=A0ABT3FRD8_9BACT|nr:DUF4332 domain-containing protein [Luteolibacter flavescens]MCW1886153.1 DUF4332 domain-containing protein [Luteolibacter flavescens]
MGKLVDIEGIGPDDAELLEATGWADAQTLAKADPEVLTREIADANAMLRIVARTPERRKVERWIAAAARSLESGAARTVRTRRDSSPAETPADRPRRKRVATTGAATSTKKEQEAPAPQESSAEADQSGELALAAVSGPVNFEADPDVAEMLAAAPLALPIPARELAARGIAPSEIAVAPLLNRALGDLDVRVTIEKPQRTELPEAPASSASSSSSSVSTGTAASPARRSPAPSVQVSDSNFPAGRRGFDSSKIRTIEEFQGDAPPVRASSSKSGMQDERIALLRSPLEKTNRGRKPGSRFFIRGVLHDKPLQVWFGGLITVLLQLLVPLAIIAAPLLILSDMKPEKFPWVPPWIIAFPLALPVFGVLYAIISTGAKCRVCAQRMYVPKQCLKNRKAHHLPLLGYIGAVALQVMVFKWYNCTFCGTSIRIKK